MEFLTRSYLLVCDSMPVRNSRAGRVPCLVIPQLDAESIGRFWSHVTKVHGCWLWNAYCNKLGYGIYGIGRKTYLAHRVAYTLEVADLAIDVLVCHTCDNPRCVRPNHLFIGDDVANSLDMISKGRARHNGHPKIPSEVIETIRSIYCPGVNSNVSLARQFGLGHSQVNNIINGKSRIGIGQASPFAHPGYLTGESHPGHKLMLSDVIEIRRLAAEGQSNSSLGQQFGVGRKNIEAIVQNRTWRGI